MLLGSAGGSGRGHQRRRHACDGGKGLGAEGRAEAFRVRNLGFRVIPFDIAVLAITHSSAAQCRRMMSGAARAAR